MLAEEWKAIMPPFSVDFMYCRIQKVLILYFSSNYWCIPFPCTHYYYYQSLFIFELLSTSLPSEYQNDFCMYFAFTIHSLLMTFSCQCMSRCIVFSNTFCYLLIDYEYLAIIKWIWPLISACNSIPTRLLLLLIRLPHRLGDFSEHFYFYDCRTGWVIFSEHFYRNIY